MRRFWIFASALMVLVSGCDRGESPSNIGRKAPQFAVSDGAASADLSKLRGSSSRAVGNLVRYLC